jgi:hypothetical protein
MSKEGAGMKRWYTMTKPDATQGQVAEDGTGKTIAVTYDGSHAALVAAAPDMLAALRSILAALSQPAVFPADLDLSRMNAREAIAKAEGNG